MFPQSPKVSPLMQSIRIVRSVHYLEAQIEAANVSMGSYVVIVSPQTRRTLRTTPSFPGGSIMTWAEIRGGQSSPEVTGGKAFCGCWNNMSFCLWGRSVELFVDAVTMALTGQIKIYATLLADVGVRYPGAFAATAPVRSCSHRATLIKPDGKDITAVMMTLSQPVSVSSCVTPS
jgi:hypothetical protein